MLSTEHQAGVITLTLQRPERGNALGPELVEGLIHAAEAAMADPAVHTLVLRGAGRHFCTGLDLTDLATLSDGDLLLRLVRIETLLALLWHAPIRTVALAHGRTWGAGADLFAVCEQRLVNSDTTLRFPGAQFGIVLGTRRLAQRIGVDAARALVLEGGELDAPQALSLGLATQLGDTAAELAAPRPDAATARAIRSATRDDCRDADLAALVRSAARPGLQSRITAYRARLVAAVA
ncbi:MAG: enoyl-CoA hydratase/isomerase family protein, partial [Betaproteobacteria bacterium]|nr:enoyl-CoA hydratase/isomerase family protein [Betaproteobacteria bacterium]